MGVLRLWNGSDWEEIAGAVPAQLRADIASAKAAAEVLAALRFDPSHPTHYGAVRGAVSAAQRTANREAIQLAADDAAIAGGTLVIKGDYEVDDQVSARCHVDGADGVIRIYNPNVVGAVLYGSLTDPFVAYGKRVELPAIIQMSKPASGWNASDIGLVVSNVHTCDITIPHIKDFSRGTLFTAKSGGNAYHNVYLGLSENNKVGLDVATEDGTGWVNEIVWFGGRFHMNSGEGTNIAGARHIVVRGAPYVNNNHLFVKPSIEGNGPQYHLEVNGRHITFVQARYEAQPPRVYLGATSNGIVFDQGFGLQDVEFTVAAGGGDNTTVNHRQGGKFDLSASAGGALIYSNRASSANPVMTFIDAGWLWSENPATGYSVQMGAQTFRFKRRTDSFDRVRIDAVNGRILMGNGAADPTAGITSVGASGVRLDGSAMGFFGTAPVAKPSVTGAKGGNVALTNLLTALANLGLITNSTT